eukprot:UN34283
MGDEQKGRLEFSNNLVLLYLCGKKFFSQCNLVEPQKEFLYCVIINLLNFGVSHATRDQVKFFQNEINHWPDVSYAAKKQTNFKSIAKHLLNKTLSKSTMQSGDPQKENRRSQERDGNSATKNTRENNDDKTASEIRRANEKKFIEKSEELSNSNKENEGELRSTTTNGS